MTASEHGKSAARPDRPARAGAWARGVLFQTLAYAGMGLMGLVGAPVVLWRRDWTLAWAGLYCRLVFAIARTICGLRIEYRGPVPDGAVLVAAKHQSMLDVFMLYDALPQARFVMKRELIWVPVFGLYALRMGSTAVNRSAKGAGDRMLDDFEKRRSEPSQIVIYPQGTRVSPGRYRRYKRGAVRAYHRFGLPMVLAATNTGVFWPRRGWAVWPGTAVVEFLETLPPDLAAEEAARLMEKTIERATARLEDEAVEALGQPPIVRQSRTEAEAEAKAP